MFLGLELGLQTLCFVDFQGCVGYMLHCWIDFGNGDLISTIELLLVCDSWGTSFCVNLL